MLKNLQICLKNKTKSKQIEFINKKTLRAKIKLLYLIK